MTMHKEDYNIAQNMLEELFKKQGDKKIKDFLWMLNNMVHNLKSGGYQQIHDNQTYQTGDIIIWNPVRNHQYGHIQIYYNGTWASDHLQDNKNTWED